jgi:N-acetylmuramoyl-L-alanine amidase
LGCPNVGFSGELLDVPAGFHQLMVRFTDNSGGMTQILRNVTVAASQIRIFIDEPAPGASLSGSFRVSGWGIATQSVTRVEILVDNTFIANATYGSARPDVCQVFPGFPQCPNVGFVANLSGIPAGQHTIVARVVDGSGGSNSTSIAITVTGGGGGGDECNTGLYR